MKTEEKKAQHTPGPWLREELFVYALHHNGDYRKGEPLLVNRFSASIQACQSQGGTMGEAEANASLISAAPDLLEALEGAHAILSLMGVNLEAHEEGRRIIAAIAKAKGE